MQMGKQRPASSPFRAAPLTGELAPDDEREFGLALDRSLSGMLPALGGLFGLGVLLFSAWDYWIAPQQAPTTALIRLGLVLLGAIGYRDWDGRIPLAWRCALVYVTHAGAMILSAALLPDGLLLALPAITGVMFPLALVEPRLPRLSALVLAPSLLFLGLAAAQLPEPAFASSVLAYLVMLGLVAGVARFQGRLVRRNFLAERALRHAARHDSLCGVLARGYLLELASHDITLARRYGHPLAIAMLDIDFFKRVNDTWGHPVGDALLRAVSQACADLLRASDYFGRVGGGGVRVRHARNHGRGSHRLRRAHANGRGRDPPRDPSGRSALHDQHRGCRPGPRACRCRGSAGRCRRGAVPGQVERPRPRRAGARDHAGLRTG